MSVKRGAQWDVNTKLSLFPPAEHLLSLEVVQRSHALLRPGSQLHRYTFRCSPDVITTSKAAWPRCRR